MIFLDQIAKGNRSQLINRLIAKERQDAMKQDYYRANLEEAGDHNQLAEQALWDQSLTDGLPNA